MRLTERDVTAIKKVVTKHFGEDALVYLFGSRTDDTKRGGDIDLLVEHDPELEAGEVIRKKLKTMTDIQFALGDRKIDIVSIPFNQDKTDGEDVPIIIKNAREEGILL